ncbi:endonuclease/exonuclease/phosphatase family protein [Neotamlana laminarinivorans]|uniref:Endonuclease/exonuclease/phosphatase family protein n=1 Tax=Neotamlana laminarinivorans TaxID=2883124 RepID=A0A9X1I2G3_9FLAO|nr:endonuclease/exonuclease/phosphatase family protein [Tamlana laminarinivorans]MCB4799087.1 endonuclease/exonuclease/phosphatase family protein [Tamlana laminarinivorans]
MKENKSAKFVFLLLMLCCFTGTAQKKNYKIHTVAFYNLENLFDTINDPNKLDEYSPMMELKANKSFVYQQKVKNMARVLADIGKDETNNSPVIIGVSEVENKTVLEDLINDSLIVKHNYGVVHYNSPDARGIDVALLYQKAFFTPISTSSHELKIYDNKTQKRVFTRNQLLVSGKLEESDIHIIVNHWPSRRGGEAKSRAKRVAAAKLTKRLADSLQVKDPYANILIMGDFNDNPNNASFKNALKAKRDKNKVAFKGIYNPFENYFKKGIGTTAYRDSWSLFDQILLTKPFLEKDYSSFKFYKAGIYNKQYIIQNSGKYKGYPFKSWSNGFTNGFSDHFPVYVFLIRELKK